VFNKLYEMNQAADDKYTTMITMIMTSSYS